MRQTDIDTMRYHEKNEQKKLKALQRYGKKYTDWLASLKVGDKVGIKYITGTGGFRRHEETEIVAMTGRKIDVNRGNKFGRFTGRGHNNEIIKRERLVPLEVK